MNARIAASLFALTVSLGERVGSQVPRPASSSGVGSAVDAVVSGGHWETKNARGHFRVVVVQLGWEEIRRTARLEWLREPSEPGPDVVTKQLDLTERAEVYALADPIIEARGRRWIVRMKAARAPLGPHDHTVEFDLGSPGSATLVRHP